MAGRARSWQRVRDFVRPLHVRSQEFLLSFLDIAMMHSSEPNSLPPTPLMWRMLPQQLKEGLAFSAGLLPMQEKELLRILLRTRQRLRIAEYDLVFNPKFLSQDILKNVPTRQAYLVDQWSRNRSADRPTRGSETSSSSGARS